MANNYVQFCVELEVAEGKTHEVKEITDLIKDSDSPATVQHPIFNSETGRLFLNIARDSTLFFTEMYPHRPKELYVFDSEYGNPEAAAHFIQMLAAHQLIVVKDYVLLTWAESCSKPRPGEFNGGACMITAEEVIWQETPNEWAHNVFTAR